MDLTTNLLLTTFPAGSKPEQVAINPYTNVAVITNQEPDGATILQLPNPVPVLEGLDPTAATAGDPGFTLTLNGSKFIKTSTVNLGSQTLTPQFISNDQLQVGVPASAITQAGIVEVFVTNPSPGGGSSNSLTFTVNNPVPTIVAISPASVIAGSSEFILTVDGANFVNASQVYFNSQSLTTTYVSINQLTAVIPASAITAPGTAQVTVVNPPPGGGTSNAVPLTIVGPVITGFTPTSGPVGISVTLQGQNFDPVAANNQVRFNGIPAMIASAGTTTIQATVPIGAATGPITVTTPQGTATSGQPFEVTLSSDFSLAAQPATLTMLQGGSTTALISLSSTGPELFTGLAGLTVSGLPSGVTANFDPSQITAGQTSALRISAAGTAATGSAVLTLTGSAGIDGRTVARTASFQLDVLAGGQTSVSGQFLTVDGEPIPNVQVRIGSTQTQTDAAGNFLLVDVPDGTQQLSISGTSPNGNFMYAADIEVTAGQANTLKPFWIMPQPPPERFTPINNATSDQVFTDPRYPGVSMTLPVGVSIIGWDGLPKTQIAIERMDPDRLGVPPPPDPVHSIYRAFFGTPMGGYLSPQGAVIPVSVPNDLGLDPGEQTELWVYDASPFGEPAAWKLAGMATVSEDGTTIVSDPGVGITRFCHHCGLWTCIIPRIGAAPPGPPPGGTKDGEPVDLRTGTFTVEKTDLVLPGRLPLTLSRSYHPFDPFGGVAGTLLSMGQGWALSADIVMVPMSSAFTVYRLILPGNYRLDLARQPDGTWTNSTHPFLSGAVLSAITEGHELKFKDGSRWRFQSFSVFDALIEQVDRNGNSLTFGRNANGRLTRISDEAGREVTFTYSGTEISQIQDPLGRTITYTYGANGRLATVTDPEQGVTTYTYDSGNRITSITDARNITFIQNFYGPSGRVLRQVQADGGEWRFVYHLQGATVAGPGCPGFSCPTEDSWENFQSGYTITSGTVTATTVIDPLGHTAIHRFNNFGLDIEQADALGQKAIITRDANNRVVATTDPLGRTTEFTYDAAGNVTSITDPENNTTTFTYEPVFNRVTSITDALGNLTTFEYDANGNLIATTDPEQNLRPEPERLKTRISYNTFGQPISVTDPLGNVTTFEYDSVGNLISTSDPLGNTTRRTYDAVSRLISLTDPLGRTTQFSYDDLNRVTQITDALNGLTQFTYDPNGNLLTVADAKNQTTTYTYDNMDRLETRTDPLNRQESYIYDPNGNLRTFTDRKSQQSIFTYDALNRRIQTDYADASRTEFSYDAVGRLARTTDTTSGAIEFSYDSLDRLIQELTPQGIVSYQYDDIGRRTSMTVNGQTPVGYQYDAASRLTQVAQGTQTVGLAYDADGRRTSLSYPNGVTTSYSYDTASRLTQILHQSSASIIEDLTYTYDAAGNRISFDRANGTATLLPEAVQAAYDAANEQIQFNSATPNLTYDADGNLISQTDANGTTTYNWDSRNRLVSISGPGISASFVYDALGRRISKTINGTTTQFLYDGNDIVTGIGGGAVTVAYFGNLSIDEPFMRQSSATEYFHTDALGSVLALTDQTGQIQTTYHYDPFGNTTVTGTSSNSFQYAGREADNTGLYYYRARYHSPTLHRFVSEDPLEFLVGDFNLYIYVGNNPINFVDPLGWDKEKSCKDGLGVLFVGIGASAFIGEKPFAIGRLFGKQATLGIALETSTGTLRTFNSVGVATFKDRASEGFGANIGLGPVFGQLPAACFEDFFGEATEETATLIAIGATKITTSSGKEGISISAGGKGIGLSGTTIKTFTEPGLLP